MFAAYDIYSSIINDLFGRVLTPDDDFFTAPFCFMPESEYGGFIVMTCQVPWLHGHGHIPGTSQKQDDWREQHFQRAREMMREYSPDIISPFVEKGPERMQYFLMLDEEDIFTFTKDGCYPGKDDISQALEDKAVKVTCEAMGWEIPTNWRQERERERAVWRVEDAFDLAEHDANKVNEMGDNKRMKYSIDPYATLISREGGEHEEEKDSLHYRHDVEHESVEFYNDDANIIDENEERHRPYLGYEYVDENEKHFEPQHVDTFYDRMDANEEGQSVEI